MANTKLFWRIFLCSFLLALTLARAVADERDSKADAPAMKDGEELSNGQMEALPDNNDPAQRQVLKCGICQSAVLQMLFTMLKIETEEGRKLKEVEVVEILESTCSKSMDEFGLILDEAGNPTRMWSNDEKVLKAKGGWITRLAETACNDIYNDYEEYLVEEGPKTCKIVGDQKKCRTAAVARHICEKGLNWCKAGTIPDDSEEALRDAATDNSKQAKEL